MVAGIDKIYAYQTGLRPKLVTTKRYYLIVAYMIEFVNSKMIILLILLGIKGTVETTLVGAMLGFGKLVGKSITEISEDTFAVEINTALEGMIRIKVAIVIKIVGEEWANRKRGGVGVFSIIIKKIKLFNHAIMSATAGALILHRVLIPEFIISGSIDVGFDFRPSILDGFARFIALEWKIRGILIIRDSLIELLEAFAIKDTTSSFDGIFGL